MPRELVRNASLALVRSAGLSDRSATPNALITSARMTPGRTPSWTGGVITIPPATRNKLAAAASARLPAPFSNKTSSALRRAAFTGDGSLLFVNAGLEADRPLDTQGDSLWWGDGFDRITEPYSHFKLVVRGYDRKQRGVRFTAHTASLDGGCGAGGPLQAACFDLDGNCIEQIEG